MFENGVDHVYDGVYVPNLYKRIAKGIIARRVPDGPPLFMWVSYNAPHTGSPRDPDDCINVHGRDITSPSPAGEGPQPFRKGGSAQGSELQRAECERQAGGDQGPASPEQRGGRLLAEVHRQRLETMQSVDRGVAAIVFAVKAAGELRNTVFVFTSDNGYMIGQHRVRQGKVLPYDPSIHVPLVIRGPEFPVGVTRSRLVATQDLAPTFVDLANGTSRLAVDGTSLVRLAKGGRFLVNRDIVLEAGPHTVGGPMAFTGLRTKKYTYVEYSTGEKGLFYNLKTDPYELKNVSGRSAYATIQKKLAAELKTMRNCSGSRSWSRRLLGLPGLRAGRGRPFHLGATAHDLVRVTRHPGSLDRVACTPADSRARLPVSVRPNELAERALTCRCPAHERADVCGHLARAGTASPTGSRFSPPSAPCPQTPTRVRCATERDGPGIRKTSGRPRTIAAYPPPPA